MLLVERVRGLVVPGLEKGPQL